MLLSLSRTTCDISEPSLVEKQISEFRPDVVVNAAAYTSVDRAESEPEAAYATNERGPRNIATSSAKWSARVIHISTDYVFDGNRSAPYPPEAETKPVNIYGASKLAGELAVQSSGADALIIRTGWLYSAAGMNFVLTILSALHARKSLQVVNDQFGVPSSAPDFAAAIWACIERPTLRGIRHWVNEGTASWFDFAVEIRKAAENLDLVDTAADISPISTEAYKSPAARPRYSVLDASGLWAEIGTRPPHWTEALATVLSAIAREK